MIAKALIVLALISVVQSCGSEVCYCASQKFPVCGINNVTYLNACFARKVYTIPVACYHSCPCKPGVLNSDSFYNINEF